METQQSKLFEAARQGSINTLQQALKDDPLILDRATLSCFNETPLHVAAMLGHIDFIKEIIRIKPELIDEMNSHKSTALHMAAAKGHVEIVRVLLSVGRAACLSLDRDKLTPLHLAAAKGHVEVLKLLLVAQPEAAYRGENILHLCVKRYQLEAMEVLVKGLGDEGFVNSTDDKGNTVLHLAVADKQVETVRFLLSVGVEVNAVNEEGMTAVDVLIRSKRDIRDPEIKKLLQHENTETITLINNHNKRVGVGKDKKKHKGSLKQHEEWLEKTKSALMVVASLIATMAFQIGVNPPGSVWQDDHATDSAGNAVEAGSSVFAQKYPGYYKRFYIVNTIAFISSLTIILLLMSGLPLRRKFFMWILMVITWTAITTIALSYFFVIDALTPTAYYNSVVYIINVTLFVWIVLMGFLLISHTIRMVVKLVKKRRKKSGARGQGNISVITAYV